MDHMLESATKKQTNKNLKVVGVHDCVRIPIPHVDRTNTDHRNILGVIVNVDMKGLYQVQTKQVLNTRFEFELCDFFDFVFHRFKTCQKKAPIYTCLSTTLLLPPAGVTDKASKNATAEGTVQ